jgi:anti-sigma factor RsiW
MNEHEESTITQDAIQEELVAYLDGELDAAARARVEERLTEDEEYRQKLMRLERAWNVLDVLPRTEADARFTQSTVEMVTVAAREELHDADRSAARWKWLGWGGGVLAVLVAGLFGYRAVDRVASRPNEQLVQDLPVIENVELYRHVDSVEFLRQLEQEGLFAQEVNDAI